MKISGKFQMTKTTNRDPAREVIKKIQEECASLQPESSTEEAESNDNIVFTRQIRQVHIREKRR